MSGLIAWMTMFGGGYELGAVMGVIGGIAIHREHLRFQLWSIIAVIVIVALTGIGLIPITFIGATMITLASLQSGAAFSKIIANAKGK